MNLDYYFPTPIWWEDTQIDVGPLQEWAYSLLDEDPAGRKLSNRGGWQSKEIALPEGLVYHIMNSCQRTIDDFGYNVEKTRLFMGNSWVNINRGPNTNQIHQHHGSFLSGVFYLKTTPESGKIFFYRNFDQAYITSSFASIENFTSLSSATVNYPPKDGRLIIFPANLSHAVDESTDDEDRISIAFNIGIRYD